MHIQLVDIHKRFGAVHANRGISLSVGAGTIHGVLGENGAGKSTLMKIVAGFLPKTSGEIRLDGEAVSYRGPADATRRGIGMLYQDPLDFPALTVLENFRFGLETAGRDPRALLADLAGRFGFDLPPDRVVERLTVGERQQLEILRLVARNVRTLILDEPTTGISATQKDVLFAALRRLADEGRSVILVSHKLEDVQVLCDRVTVLREGRVAGEAERPLRTNDLLGLMFGTVPHPPPRCENPAGTPVLRLDGVSAPGGRAGLRDCTVAIRRGEVVGLAGVEGSGQGVFLRVAAGMVRPRRGRVLFEDAPLGRRAAAGRVAFLPTDRLGEGLVPGLTVREHFVLRLPRVPFLLDRATAGPDARAGIDRLSIRGTPGTPVEALSGGNQQRLLLALLPERPAVLLLENPTRGLDLESAHGVWRELQRYCDAGTALVFSSPELDEILLAADRILVFHNGRMVLDTPASRTTPDELARAIAGLGTGAAA